MSGALFNSELARQIIECEQPWAMSVIKSITLNASSLTGVHNSHLTLDYDGKRVRYQVIHADYNQDRTEVTFQLRLDRILNEGDPE